MTYISSCTSVALRPTMGSGETESRELLEEPPVWIWPAGAFWPEERLCASIYVTVASCGCVRGLCGCVCSKQCFQVSVSLFGVRLRTPEARIWMQFLGGPITRQ